MKKILIFLGCLLAVLLLWVIVPDEASVETIDCGNGVELIKRTSSSCGTKRSLYGINKNGTCLLNPTHKMLENGYLKLRVFYGPNSKIHVFDMETGERVLTGRVSGGHCPDDVCFDINDEGENDNYVLSAHYYLSISPVQHAIETIAVFTRKDGKTCLVSAR